MINSSWLKSVSVRYRPLRDDRWIGAPCLLADVVDSDADRHQLAKWRRCARVAERRRICRRRFRAPRVGWEHPTSI
jgi:hypothetical protein